MLNLPSPSRRVIPYQITTAMSPLPLRFLDFLSVVGLIKNSSSFFVNNRKEINRERSNTYQKNIILSRFLSFERTNFDSSN